MPQGARDHRLLGDGRDDPERAASAQGTRGHAGPVGEPGAYRLAQALPPIQVPATVQAVLAARIDRLPPEEKRLLQTAAVIGTDVSLPLLQTIAELPEDALHRGLKHLQAAEFLYETRLFPECEYTFKHALTHEVAYSSLLLERRRVLHARIVEALEALAGDRVAEQVERLANHALRGEVWDRAPAYCRQAGEKAMMRSAYGEAVGYFEQTLRALSYLPETHGTREQAIDRRLALRSALLPSGDFGRILGCLHEAESFASAIDDPRRLGQVSLFLSFHFSYAMEMGGLHALCSLPLGEAYLLAGRPEDTSALAERTLALAHEHQERGHQAHALRLLGEIASQREPPKHDQAEVHYRQALALAEELGMRPLQAHCHCSLGKLYATIGRGAEARAELSTAIELYRAMAMTFWLPGAEATLVQVEG